MISTFRRWFTREAAKPVDWEQVRSRLLASAEVKAGRTGHNPKLSKEASLLVDLVVSGNWSDHFEAHLKDDDARIVAYCLIGLELMDSAVLERLPESLFQRGEPIKLLRGHTILELPLNTLAQEIANRHNDGRSLERWLSFGYQVERQSLDAHLQRLRVAKHATPV